MSFQNNSASVTDKIKFSINTITLTPLVTGTTIPLTTKPKLVRKSKITIPLNVIIVAVAIVLVFIFVTFLLVVRKRRLRRKSLKKLARFQREASQIQLINQGTLQSSICSRTFDDSAYVDPSICTNNRKEKNSAGFIDPNVSLSVIKIPNNVDAKKKNADEKKNSPDYVEPNILSDKSNKKKDPNYEYPLVSQLLAKKKTENNEYEICGQVQPSNHEYVDIIGGGRFHYYTDPEKALQNYIKKRQSEHTNTESKDANEASNPGYAKLLVSEQPCAEVTNSEDTNESTVKYESIDSHLILNNIYKDSNSNDYPGGYARLTIVNNKKDLSPNYFQLEPDEPEENAVDEIAI